MCSMSAVCNFSVSCMHVYIKHLFIPVELEVSTDNGYGPLNEVPGGALSHSRSNDTGAILD